MKERAYAKINLCLDVIRKREDGYHELKSIMVPVNFYDWVEINFAETTSLERNRSYIPNNPKNTVLKAIEVCRQEYGFTEQFFCKLTKQIPTQAGLGGGSADAAATLRILNRLLGLKMDFAKMMELGAKVGADVPFCVFNRPALVEGIGEKITGFDCSMDFLCVLVKPRMGVSTKEAFAHLDFDTIQHPSCENMQKALMENDYPGMIAALGNSLEQPSLKLVPAIAQVREDLVAGGMDGVLMSGSGSTVFGITQDIAVAKAVAKKMRKQGMFTRITGLYHPVNR